VSEIGIAVIGVGDIGGNHARALSQTHGARLVAVCDSDPAALERFAVSGIPGPAMTRDHREVLDRDDVDAVVICVPDDLHAPLAIEALRAGKHLFLEKPVANTLADIDILAEEAARTDRVVQIGLVYRFSNLYREMADLTRRELGGPMLMWCKELRQCFPQHHWFYRRSCTGGTLVEKDCHHFDLFNWMIGAEPVRIFATGGQHVWRRGEPVEIDCNYCPLPPEIYDDIDVVDHALVTIDYANGAKANLMLCMYLVPENLTPQGLEVGAIGRNGKVLQATRDTSLILSGGREEPLVRPIPIDPDSLDGSHIGFRTQHVEFLRAIQTGATPAADLTIGRKSVLVALAAERSIETGQPVDIASFEAESRVGVVRP
jgi:predicted dehydrogenase